MVEEKKPRRGKDTTQAKRQADLRQRKTKVEAFLDPAEYAEVDALIAAGEASDKADLVRKSLHEKYLRWQKKDA